MVAPVYTETQECRIGIQQLESGRMAADRKTSVFVSNNKVAMTNSSLIVGVPRGADHKSKRYYSWITTASFGFFRNSAGYPQPYAVSRRWDANRKTPWRHSNAAVVFSLFGEQHADTGGGKAFIHGCWETFGHTKFEHFYPIADKYNLTSYTHIPYNLRTAMRENDWASFAARAFGKTRATPRLIAAVANTEPYVVALASQFRGVVSNEVMTKFIEDTHFDDEMEEGFQLHNPNVRKIALALGTDNATAILQQGLDLDDTHRIRQMCGPRLDWHILRARQALGGKTLNSWADLFFGS